MSEEEPKKTNYNPKSLENLGTNPITAENRAERYKPPKTIFETEILPFPERMDYLGYLIYTGKTDEEISIDFKAMFDVEISQYTLHRYRQKPDVEKYLAPHRRARGYKAEGGLFRRAIGYKYEQVIEESGETDKGSFSKTTTKNIEVPPDTLAGIYITKNVLPDIYKDRTEQLNETKSLSAVFLIPSTPEGKLEIPKHLKVDITEQDIKELLEKNPNAKVPEELLAEIKKRKNGNGSE